jgi:5-deoxy-D-glucuronate isomerase
MMDQTIGVEKPDDVRIHAVRGNATNLFAISNLLGENVPLSDTLLIVRIPANGKDYSMRVAEITQLLDV